MDTSVITSSIAQSVFDRPVSASDFANGRMTEVPLSTFVMQLENRRSASGGAQSAWCTGERLPLQSLGVVGEVIAKAPTLAAALRNFVLGFPLVQSNTTLSMEITEDRVRVGYRILDPDIWPRRGDAELTLAIIHSVCMRFGMDRHALLDVGFEHEADDATCSISRYNQTDTLCDESENYLVFPVRCLSLTRQDAKSAAQVGWDAPDQLLSSHLRHLPVSRRVRHQILHRIGLGSIGQMDIARELGMSERTLRRALAAEGTPYHDIRDECRRSMALALLKRPGLSLNDVAFSLGYSDQTAFSRAFSRWFGEPPSRHCVVA